MHWSYDDILKHRHKKRKEFLFLITMIKNIHYVNYINYRLELYTFFKNLAIQETQIWFTFGIKYFFLQLSFVESVVE